MRYAEQTTAGGATPDVSRLSQKRVTAPIIFRHGSMHWEGISRMPDHQHIVVGLSHEYAIVLAR